MEEEEEEEEEVQGHSWSVERDLSKTHQGDCL